MTVTLNICKFSFPKEKKYQLTGPNEKHAAEKKCFEWESNLQPNHYGVVSFRWGLTDRAMSDTSPSRISTNENYFYHWKSNQVQQTDQTIIYFWFQAVLPHYYFVKMKTWKTEKARLMRHGVPDTQENCWTVKKIFHILFGAFQNNCCCQPSEFLITFE